MTKHRHFIRNIRQRTVKGKRVLCAWITQENGMFHGAVMDVFGTVYVTGSNSRILQQERRCLREMLDPQH